MASKILKVCDGDGTQAWIPNGPFGAHAVPDGWLSVVQNGAVVAEACSYRCVEAIGKREADQLDAAEVDAPELDVAIDEAQFARESSHDGP
jgi:hypothetical protein